MSAKKEAAEKWKPRLVLRLSDAGWKQLQEAYKSERRENPGSSGRRYQPLTFWILGKLGLGGVVPLKRPVAGRRIDEQGSEAPSPRSEAADALEAVFSKKRSGMSF